MTAKRGGREASFHSQVTGLDYSRLPITRTFTKKVRAKVRVIGSSEKIAKSKEKNSFYCIVNILIAFNCRNVK